MATLHAIHSQAPVPPSTLNPHIPPPLEALILAMLHKDASLRPTAAEVDAALMGSGTGNALRRNQERGGRTICRRKERRSSGGARNARHCNLFCSILKSG